MEGDWRLILGPAGEAAGAAERLGTAPSPSQGAGRPGVFYSRTLASPCWAGLSRCWQVPSKQNRCVLLLAINISVSLSPRYMECMKGRGA